MGKPTQRVVALEVVEIETNKVVHTVPLQAGSDPDRVTAGMLINMDTDRFFVREVKGKK